jgi:transposase-like protein
MSEKVISHPTIQRWTANRKAEVVLEILKGQKTLVDAARSYDVKQSEIQGWIDTFLESGRRALKTNPKSLEGAHESQLKAHREKIGELVLQIDVLKKAKAILSEEETLCGE